MSLANVPGLVYGISRAKDGNMSFLYGEQAEVVKNRRKFLESFNIDPNHAVVTQLVHKDDIVDVTEQDWGKGLDTPETLLTGDVLVTTKPDTFLFFVVADCLALLVFEPVKGVCALAHAGWRGVDQEVPKKTVQYLVERHGCDPSKLLVAMSPACQRDSSCFEDVAQYKTTESKERWEPYITKKEKLFCVDWVRFAYDQLIAAGVPEQNIERSIIDTRSDEQYFSHRRSVEEKIPEARFACFVGFKK